VDVSGKCPGFATLPSFNKGVLNRNATLSKAIWARYAEIKRRTAAETAYTAPPLPDIGPPRGQSNLLWSALRADRESTCDGEQCIRRSFGRWRHMTEGIRGLAGCGATVSV
jgi:hypothetical protein